MPPARTRNDCELMTNLWPNLPYYWWIHISTPWLRGILWGYQGGHSDKCSTTSQKGGWPVHDGEQQSCRGQIDATFAHKILDFLECTLLLGFLRNSQQLNHLFFVWNLLPWRMELRSCGALDTSIAWWVFPFLDRPMSMVTTCLSFTSLIDPSWHWNRRTCPFATTLFARLLWWGGSWHPMCG